jgi:hypothetical protein
VVRASSVNMRQEPPRSRSPTVLNRMAIKRAELEERVLGALKSNLMDPALFREFCDEFTREMNRLRSGRGSRVAADLLIPPPK